MSKMKCECGNILSNATIPCRTEGWLLCDQDMDRCSEDFEADIEPFLAVVHTEERKQWLTARFGPHYPVHLPDAQVVIDLMNSCEQKYRRSIAECDSCGRIWIQAGPSENRYQSYRPDQGEYAGILASTEEST